MIPLSDGQGHTNLMDGQDGGYLGWGTEEYKGGIRPNSALFCSWFPVAVTQTHRT